MADVESLELQIKGNASGATKSLNALIRTLDKLEKATAGGCGLKKVNKEFQKFQKVSIGVKSVNKNSALSFANLAAKVTAVYATLKEAGEVVASWIKESSNYTENLNLFTVAMGEYAGAAMEYANNVSEVMGIDPSDWVRSQGVFMTLATGFGIASDRASVMSEQLTQLGYDLSSFYNLDVAESMNKLKSGLAGELEPLRSLGYDLSDAKLKATALSLGITKATKDMTQAEKAQLRYYAIMTQVTQVHGDMARTLDAPANQIRVFQAQVTQAARALGNIFIPVLNKLLPYAIAAAKVIRYLADAIAKLAGYEFPQIEDSPVMSLGDSAAEASESIDKTTTSAKKLKKTLLGIDELNVLPDASTSDSGKDNEVGAWADFELPTYKFIDDAVTGKVDEIVEKMKEWLGINGEIESWADLMDTKFGTILKTVGLVGGAIVAWKIGNGVATGIGAVSKAFGFLKKLGIGKLFGDVGAFFQLLWEGNSLGDVLSAAFPKISAFFAGIPTAILGGVAGILAGVPMLIAGLWDALSEGLNWINGGLIAAGTSLTGAGVGAIIGSLGGPIGAGIGGLIGLAVGLITDFGIWLYQNWDEVCTGFNNLCTTVATFFSDLWKGITATASSCWKSVKTAWSDMCEWFDTKVIEPVNEFFATMWTDIKTGAITAWNGIKTEFNFIRSWIDTNVVKPVSNYFSGLWDGFLKNARSAWETTKSVFSEATSFFKNTFSDAWKKVVNVFSTGGQIFVDIKDGILTGFKKVVNDLIKGLNKVIAVPFNGINEALRWIRDIEIVGLTPFSNLKTVSVPTIPYLADGGMVDKGQMFVAREAGPELVGSIGNRSAVVNNDQIVSAVSQGVYQAVVQAMSQSSGNQTVEAKVNDKVLFEVVVNRARQETVRKGFNPLLGGV